MSYKTKPLSKTPGDRYQKRSAQLPSKCHSKVGFTTPTVKTNKHNCCSAGILSKNSNIIKPKKTTVSESVFNIKDPFARRGQSAKNCHYKACGDTVQSKREAATNIIFSAANVSSSLLDDSGPVEQFYRNEKFQPSVASVQGDDWPRRVSFMDTIKEQSKENYFLNPQYEEDDNSSDEIQFIESDIENLKQFRNENYFECHSAFSKVNNKYGVTGLDDHKCLYRFYLNERLFPVPVNTDYNNLTRCTECQLPLETIDSEHKDLHGTIQAKVKINGQLQDIMLMLPVKKTLIIKERRKEMQEKKDDDHLYFGIVKLSIDGDSMFNRNLPTNSLALRYQKGYQEHRIKEHYQYESINKNDVIII